MNAVGKDGRPYSHHVSLKKLAKEIFKQVKKKYKEKHIKITDKQIANQLCNNLHLAHIITERNQSDWGDKYVFGNHSKTWIIDNDAFYVGSHNLYPANLQEYGYIFFGKKITNKFIKQYWNKLWALSKNTDISGNKNSCVFCRE